MEVHQGSFFSVTWSDGVLCFTPKLPVDGTVEQAWEWMNLLLDIRAQLGRPFPMLTLMTHSISFSDEGREVLRNMSDLDHALAHAVVATKKLHYLMARVLIILVPHARIVVKVFDKEAKAHDWLLGVCHDNDLAPIGRDEAAVLDLKQDRGPRTISMDSEH